MSISGDDNGPGYDYRDFRIKGAHVVFAFIMVLLFAVIALVGLVSGQDPLYAGDSARAAHSGPSMAISSVSLASASMKPPD